MLRIEMLDIVILARFEHQDFIGLRFVMCAGDIFNEAYGLANVFVASYGTKRYDDAENDDNYFCDFFGIFADD